MSEDPEALSVYLYEDEHIPDDFYSDEKMTRGVNGVNIIGVGFSFDLKTLTLSCINLQLDLVRGKKFV